MASPAEGPRQEYWRPSNPDVARVIPSIRGICWRCGMDYSPGARFCHFCGGARDPRGAEPVPEPQTSSREDVVIGMYRRLGLSIPCLVLFVIGITFVIAAALTGIVYREDTLVDWQAVQMWRVEWLLASAVALLAGILLKKNET